MGTPVRLQGLLQSPMAAGSLAPSRGLYPSLRHPQRPWLRSWVRAMAIPQGLSNPQLGPSRSIFRSIEAR